MIVAVWPTFLSPPPQNYGAVCSISATCKYLFTSNAESKGLKALERGRAEKKDKLFSFVNFLSANE
jgi:hypothetical protein